MELTIEQPCPSCGAAIILHEDDRVIRCEFCDVPNFRVREKLPRYVLPARLPGSLDEDDLLYVPYLRFKGCIYSIQGLEVKHRLIDTTRIGCEASSLPVSLGVRPQAMKILPVTESLGGGFVRQSVKATKIFAEAVKLTRLFTENSREPVLHRAFIGESVTRMYLPVYPLNGLLYDAVSQQPLGADEVVAELRRQRLGFQREWEPRFISTLCPSCGDVMHGSRETQVMLCANCAAQWLEEDGRFQKIEHFVLAAKEQGARYLPFWRIEPEEQSGRLGTFADFLELTNQPLIIRPRHRQQPMAFIVPAFKINPTLFLQTSRMLTVGQCSFAEFEHLPIPVQSVYPVTLSHQEAAESLKSVLGASAVSARRVVGVLPSLVFARYRKKLVYLPFRDSGHDFIEQHSGVSISAAALRHGRKL